MRNPVTQTLALLSVAAGSRDSADPNRRSIDALVPNGPTCPAPDTQFNASPQPPNSRPGSRDGRRGSQDTGVNGLDFAGLTMSSEPTDRNGPKKPEMPRGNTPPPVNAAVDIAADRILSILKSMVSSNSLDTTRIKTATEEVRKASAADPKFLEKVLKKLEGDLSRDLALYNAIAKMDLKNNHASKYTEFMQQVRQEAAKPMKESAIIRAMKMSSYFKGVFAGIPVGIHLAFMAYCAIQAYLARPSKAVLEGYERDTAAMAEIMANTPRN